VFHVFLATQVQHVGPHFAVTYKRSVLTNISYRQLLNEIEELGGEVVRHVPEEGLIQAKIKYYTAGT
jgi:hypothetical protein